MRAVSDVEVRERGEGSYVELRGDEFGEATAAEEYRSEGRRVRGLVAGKAFSSG